MTNRLFLYFAAIFASFQVCAEPYYQGKPESYWVNLLTNWGSYQTMLQWRELGTNRQAVLLKAVYARDVPNAELIRSNACLQLSGIGDAAILIALARSSFDPQVRAAALGNLVFHSDESITAVQVDALRDTNAIVRAAGIAGLGLTAKGFIPGELLALVKCLQDPEPALRLEAAMNLVMVINSGSKSPAPEEVISAALLEIKRAAANSDTNISIPATIALHQPDYFVPGAYARELWMASQELAGTNWSATLRVVDENDMPIADADTSMGIYIHDLDFFGHIVDRSEEIKGRTDTNGLFFTASKGLPPSSFTAAKVGYYSSFGSHEFVSLGKDDPSLRTASFKLVLKKKIHPVPMYVNRVDIAHQQQRPPFDKLVGFDLMLGDFVAPFGKGTNTHLFFSWHVDYDTNDLTKIYGTRTKHGWNETMAVSFPNPGDGIIEVDLPGILDNRRSEGNVGSELRLAQLAPENGYQSQLVKTNRWSYRKLPSLNDYDHLHKNYIFRVNTILSSDGHIKSAQFGKIHGDFEEAMTTYLNPEPNSRELEFDVGHNLSQGGNNFYFTY